MTPLLLTLSLAHAGEWTARVGAEVNADPHGVLDLGWRAGDWQVALWTDTLEVRWQPEGERGRAWAALRAEGGAAGLMISPWQDGAPAPEQALAASYVGLEGGALRYLPNGLYAGGQAFARLYGFGGLDATTVELPGPRVVLRPEAVLGWWRPWTDGWLLAGAHVAPGAPTRALQPHTQLTARFVGPWIVAPRAELRAGWAQGQDPVTRTRVGGLNPYVVPVGGAAWAEWWAEDYAAARVGPRLRTAALDVSLLVDAALVDGRAVSGFALDTEARWRRLVLDVDVGWAPWIERAPGVSATSVWFAVGSAWGRGSPTRAPEPEAAEPR